MNKRDATWMFLGACISLLACATKFPVYRYYGMNLPEDCYTQGVMVGSQTPSNPGGWQSLPMSECTPDAQLKGKCWIELNEDHVAKENELEACRTDLAICQAGPMPTPAPL